MPVFIVLLDWFRTSLPTEGLLHCGFFLHFNLKRTVSLFVDTSGPPFYLELYRLLGFFGSNLCLPLSYLICSPGTPAVPVVVTTSVVVGVLADRTKSRHESSRDQL